MERSDEMTTYYYYIDPGSIDSTTSIVEARKQTMKFVKKYKRQFAYIRTNSFGGWEEGLECVIDGILGYRDFVVARIGKKRTVTNVLNKDGTLGRIIKG